MQKALTPQSAPACKQLSQWQPKLHDAVCRPSVRHVSSKAVQREARQSTVSAVQRAQSPSRIPTFDRLTVPEVAPAVSLHPDAVKRRKEAEER